MSASPFDPREDPLGRFRRLRDLGRLLKDEQLPQGRADILRLEYAELAVTSLEDFIADEDACDPCTRDELRDEVVGWRGQLDAIYVRALRGRVTIRWRGTAVADIELDGWMVAEMHHEDDWGWMLYPAGDELGLPTDRIAPPGLTSTAADLATQRALARVTDHLARILERSADTDVCD
jgi:hypothetical protein